MTEPTCVIEHSRDEDQPQAWIGGLCRWHRNRLDFLTREISENFVNLALIIEAGSAPKDTAPKTRHMKSASPPAPVNLDVLVLRDPRTAATELRQILQDGQPADLSRPSTSVLAVVASWTLLLAEERPLTTDLPSSVVGQLDLLTRHHDWIADEPWISDYFTELTDLRKAINAALRDRSSFRRLGSCYLPTEDGVCGGQIMQENGSEVARCRGCNASWTTPQQLARLEVALHGAKTA